MITKFSLLTLFVLVVGSHGKKSDNTMQFEEHFEQLSEVRHPNFKEGVPWQEAREYIRDKFNEYGVNDVQTQTFVTTITTAGPESSQEVEGVNIIGIMEGADKSGPIMLVGADYDTPKKGDPFRNNGGGVACLLETVRIFQDRVKSDEYYQNYTVIFAAFDLNTKEYLGANEGHPGSYFFVRKWLDRYLLNGVREFLGAIILDSVSTYNTVNNTQTLAPGFNLLFPEANDEIKQRGMKGDYLGFLYTKNAEENPIKEAFINNYRKERIMYKFRLQEMDVHFNFSAGYVQDAFETFNHQAHYNFWTNPNNVLPAFLLFDTDQYRVESSPYFCSEEDGCSVEQFLTQDRAQFLTKTTNTVVQTLLQLQTTRIDTDTDPDPGNSSSAQGGSVILLLMAMTAYVLRL